MQVLQEDENNVKALFRKGQALNGLNKWDEALVSYLLKLFVIYWPIGHLVNKLLLIWTSYDISWSYDLL